MTEVDVSQHTPGPWTAFSTNVDAGDVHNDGVRVAKCWSSTFAPPPQEAIANARLIAAAPELLAALEAVVRVADRKTDEFDLAHAAIAKAKGKT
jgi:hypothetical protein